jgi:hypothetical protein
MINEKYFEKGCDFQDQQPVFHFLSLSWRSVPIKTAHLDSLLYRAGVVEAEGTLVLSSWPEETPGFPDFSYLRGNWKEEPTRVSPVKAP